MDSGTYVYAAPETYNGQGYTTKADVYSFGIILWEMAMRVITGTASPFSLLFPLGRVGD
jgi:serine/threonine protein kinase